MRNPPPEIENDKIQRLVASETDPALAKFRAGDFEADVRKRISRISIKKRDFSPIRTFPRLARFAIAGGLLIAGIIFILLIQKTSRPNMAQTIEAVLSQTGGFLAKRYDVLEQRQPEGEVFSAAENFLTTALRNASSAQNPAAPSPAPARTPRVKPLRLEEIYKILFIDKAIEHVLMLISS